MTRTLHDTATIAASDPSDFATARMFFARGGSSPAGAAAASLELDALPWERGGAGGALVIARDEDYYSAYTTRRSFITGALSTLYREQVTRVVGLALSPPADPAAIPQVPYTDDAWREYVRSPEHSGVLTTAAFLGRFPTWRSRINQFRSALLCRPFEPPAGGLPSPEDVCNREPNLAARCGCQHCHSAIEPLAAYWGRWAERTSMYLDPVNFPAFDPNCAQCANTGQFCTTRCRSFYVTQAIDADGSRYAGTLFSALYRSSEEMGRMERGPGALVQEIGRAHV